jgi:GT2 family glycosyltransferase
MSSELIVPSAENSQPRPPNGEKVPQGQPVSVLSPPGLASILVPCCGQLEYTELCLRALLRHTRPPYELIFVDIGSLDGTNSYLRGIAAASGVRVEIVRTATDLGIPQVIEEAVKLARGEFIVLVNNDTIVTHGWLNQLVQLVRHDPQHGLAGPMSNYAAPPQLVENVPYRIRGQRTEGEPLLDTSAVDAFAKQWYADHKGKWTKCQRLGGFCLLIKREVLKRIGHLREWSDLALFDTDLLSVKARQAGFTLTCCLDLFVHHFGTRSFVHGAPKAREQRTEDRGQ